jgi:hypothetical protein
MRAFTTRRPLQRSPCTAQVPQESTQRVSRSAPAAWREEMSFERVDFLGQCAIARRGLERLDAVKRRCRFEPLQPVQ